MWFRSQDTAINQGHLWWANAMMIGHEMNSTPNDWGITMGGGKICWGSGNYSSPFVNDLDGTTDQAFCTVNSNYNNGNWTYLFVTRTNGNEDSINSEVKIYINGIQVGSTVTSSTALKTGTGARGFALLNTVPVWYELWRQINGFPPDYYKTKETTKKAK